MKSFRSCTFISGVKSFRAMNDGKLEYFFLSLNIWQLSGLIIWQLFFIYSKWEIKIKRIESTARDRLDKYVESCKTFSDGNTIGKCLSHTCSVIFGQLQIVSVMNAKEEWFFC